VRSESNRNNYAEKDQVVEEHKDLLSQYRSLERALRTRESDSNQMIANLQLELQNSRRESQRFNFKVPDDLIKQDFNNLESNVRQFVDKYFAVVLKTPYEDLQSDWPSWSPQLPEFLASPCLSGLALEGYVWGCLFTRVFAPWSEVWAPGFGQAMDKALRIAGGNEPQLSFPREFELM
jgi:hypothetical protein